MAVLTEEMLRRQLRTTGSKTITIEDDIVLTPSAREFIKAHDLHLTREEVEDKPQETREEVLLDDLYKLYEGPGYIKDKPFYMAELEPKTLISKDHPRYVFFQKLDGFLAQVLIDISELPDKDRTLKEGLEDLYWILLDVKEKQARDLTFKAFSFLGMTEEALDEKLDRRKEEGQAPFRALGPGSKKESLTLYRLVCLLRELESMSLDPQITGGKEESLNLAEEIYRSTKGLDYLAHVCEYGG